MNKNLQRIIQEGQKLIGRDDLNEEMFHAWLKYSLTVFNIICENSYAKYRYSDMCVKMATSDIETKQKLNKCIVYLINVSPII